MHCTYCNANLPDTAAFCTSCGLAVKIVPTSATTPKPAPAPAQPVQQTNQQPVQQTYQQPVQQTYQQPVQQTYQQPVQQTYQQPVKQPSAPVNNTPRPVTRKINKTALICAACALISSFLSLIHIFEFGGTLLKYADFDSVSGIGLLRFAIDNADYLDEGIVFGIGIIGFLLTLFGGLSILFAILGTVSVVKGNPNLRGRLKLSYVFSFVWSLMCVVLGFIASTVSAVSMGTAFVSLIGSFWIIFALSAANLGMHLSALDASLERERFGLSMFSPNVKLANARRYGKNLYGLIFGVIGVLPMFPSIGFSNMLLNRLGSFLGSSFFETRFSPFQVLIYMVAGSSAFRIDDDALLLCIFLFIILVFLELLIFKNAAVCFFKAPTAKNWKKIRKAGTKERVEIAIWAILLIGFVVILNLAYLSNFSMLMINASIISLKGTVVFLLISSLFCLGKIKKLIVNISREDYEGTNLNKRSLAMFAGLSAVMLCAYTFIAHYDEVKTGYTGFFTFIKVLPISRQDPSFISMIAAIVIIILGIFPLRSYLGYFERMFQSRSDDELRKFVTSFAIMNLIATGIVFLYCLFIIALNNGLDDFGLSIPGYFVIVASIAALIAAPKVFKPDYNTRNYY